MISATIREWILNSRVDFVGNKTRRRSSLESNVEDTRDIYCTCTWTYINSYSRASDAFFFPSLSPTPRSFVSELPSRFRKVVVTCRVSRNKSSSVIIRLHGVREVISYWSFHESIFRPVTTIDRSSAKREKSITSAFTPPFYKSTRISRLSVPLLVGCQITRHPSVAYLLCRSVSTRMTIPVNQRLTLYFLMRYARCMCVCVYVLQLVFLINKKRTGKKQTLRSILA